MDYSHIVWTIFVSLVFSLNIWAEADLSNIIEQTQKDFPLGRGLESAVTLEDGALAKRDELESFLLFSEEKRSPAMIINSFKEDGALLDYPDKALNLYQINKTIVLKNLIANDCKELYCFQYYLSFDYIPSLFWKGLIGVEDQRYLDHRGIDIRSVLRAFVANLKKGKFEQGGSTISQQLVKNIFYSSEKTFTRKLKEMFSSLYLETKLSKEKILEVYLNQVEWGALQGIRVKGIYAASVFYFGKRPEDITPFEGAILIGLLKGPGFYSPLKHLDRLKERVAVVLEKLKEEKLISLDSKNYWKEVQWKNFKERLLTLERDRPYHSLWKSMNDPLSSIGSYEKFVLIHKIDELKTKIKVRFEKKQLTVARDDIAIKALLVPVIDEKETMLYRYYSKIERSLDRAISGETHQIGSTLKPILYGLFQGHGKKMSDLVSTQAFSLSLPSGSWSPQEAHELKVKEVTLSEALLKSLNRPVIRIASEIGFDQLAIELKEYIPTLKLPLSEFPSQLLGSAEMSVNDLKTLYVKWIRSECLKIKAKEKTFEESPLSILSDPNKTTVEYSVDAVMNKLKFFGKTGTTNKGLDNWYVAFDGKNLTIIWVGYEGARNEKSLGLYGSTTAFTIFQNYFRDRGRRFEQFSCDSL